MFVSLPRIVCCNLVIPRLNLEAQESLQGIKLGPSSMPTRDIHTELVEPHGSSMIYMLHFEEHTKFTLS